MTQSSRPSSAASSGSGTDASYRPGYEVAAESILEYIALGRT
ncbi:hypothetical protein [Streptomyces endocoffeicus]|nr:hypothetical protein [Streptomyces endocoffeicus]